MELRDELSALYEELWDNSPVKPNPVVVALQTVAISCGSDTPDKGPSFMAGFVSGLKYMATNPDAGKHIIDTISKNVANDMDCTQEEVEIEFIEAAEVVDIALELASEKENEQTETADSSS